MLYKDISAERRPHVTKRHGDIKQRHEYHNDLQKNHLKAEIAAVAFD
jgi:hypothetical protein